MSERDLEMKSFGPFEIKSEDKGEVVAVVATLGVVDKDGDVILPGAFRGGARVKLSGYGHDVVTEGKAPAGKGIITEEGDKAIFRGNFFMSTQRGREAFHTTKELGPEGEWSFGFPKAVKTADLTDEWRTKGARRVIKELDAIEASPVFVGAGWGTGTLLTKSAEPEPEPVPSLEEVDKAFAEGRVEISGSVVAETVVETPADEMARQAAERQAAEDAEAKATAEVEATLKAQRDEAIAEALGAQRRLAKIMGDCDSVRRVQQAMRRLGHLP